MTYEEVVSIMGGEPVCLIQFSSVLFEYELDDGTFLVVRFDKYKVDMNGCILRKISFYEKSAVDTDVALDVSLQKYPTIAERLEIGMTYGDLVSIMGDKFLRYSEETPSFIYEIENGVYLYVFFNRYKQDMSDCVLSMASVEQLNESNLS